MDFIYTGDRYVSVRHIRAFEIHPEDREVMDILRRRVSRIWIEGETEPINVTKVVYSSWIEKASLPVVPAAPGWVALSYSRTATAIEIKRAPILAWRVVHGFWTPSAE